MSLIETAAGIVGADRVLTGAEADPWRRDWTGTYPSDPLAVVRPGSTAEVAALVRAARDAGTAIVPVSGNTGLTGAAQADGALVVSLDRMARIREIRSEARLATVEAGVILSQLHDAAEAELKRIGHELRPLDLVKRLLRDPCIGDRGGFYHLRFEHLVREHGL